MGKFKDIMNEEQKNMPVYQYTFLYKRVLPGLFFVVGGAIVSFALAVLLYFVTDSEGIAWIPILIWMVAVCVLLILFCIYGKKISLRLIEEKTKEIQKKYAQIEFAKAVADLADQSLIVNNAFILDQAAVPLENCMIYFFCKTVSGKFEFYLFIYDCKSLELLHMYELNDRLCTFFEKDRSHFINRALFDLFLQDKNKFLKLLYKYNDPEKMLKKINGK